jgi:Arc/MetJ-type ribon-helix-helix transcriptional regulator
LLALGFRSHTDIPALKELEKWFNSQKEMRGIAKLDPFFERTSKLASRRLNREIERRGTLGEFALEPVPISPARQEIAETEEPEQPPIIGTTESVVQKPLRRSVVRGKRLGRPPFAAEIRASTVYLPESVYAELEALANKSGKKGFKRPGLSEAVRAALRLVQRREWSSDEISQAFAEDITGIQTIALRCEWERTRSVRLKESLLAYNRDDCAALELLSLEMIS